MFGGADLKTLYVTSINAGLTPGSTQPQAGGLFAIEGTGAQGLKETPFRG
jgi:sugar lactone lactonase YvrE